MKTLVITQDKCTRINPTNGEIIEAFRPSVVTVTEFVSNLVMKRSLRSVDFELPDTASDSEFEKFFIAADRNIDLAIDSYLSKVTKDMGLSEEAQEAAAKQAQIDAVEATKKQEAIAAAAAAVVAAEKQALEATAKAAAEAAAKAGAK